MSRPQRNASHRTFSSSNYASRTTGHGAEGRLRIDFNNSTFLKWCKHWGPNVFSKSFEYRKKRTFPYHEYIQFQDLYAISRNVHSSTSRAGDHTVSSDSGVPKIIYRGLMKSSTIMETTLRSSSLSNDSDQVWWIEVPEDINDKPYMLKFEREANPETQLNAFHRTEAYDFVYLNSSGTNDDNSTLELAIEFPTPMALEHVIKICASISHHQHASMYSLLQFNCYFFSWSITAILVRMHMDGNWARALRQDTAGTATALAKRMVELSDPGRIRGQGLGSDSNTEVRPNLALFLAGEYSLGETHRDRPEQRPFIRQFLDSLNGISTFEAIASALVDDSERPLWPCDQIGIIRDKMRELLNNVADSTMGLATAGTGESNVAALFWGETSIHLEPGWVERVEDEYGRLIDVYIERMWTVFREALEKTGQAERPSGQANPTGTILASLETLCQRIANSPAVLGPRLTGLGVRAAWNGAGVAASTDFPNPQGQKFRRTMKKLQYTPGQIWNVLQIAGPFLELVAMRRERTRAAGAQPLPNGEDPMSLDAANILRMMGNIDFNPEGEDEIVLELERSVKNMAMETSQSSGPSVQELREATLALLIRLKDTGREINFGLDPDRVWRVCVWCSLSEHIIQQLVQAPDTALGSDRRIRCWFGSPESNSRSMGGEKRPMESSKILEFIQWRIAKLSDIFVIRDGEEAEACCIEIENAMTKIWQDIPLDDQGGAN